MPPIPERTIERLCAYRRILVNWWLSGKTHFHSHELADEARITSAQVRRDMMSLNTIGTPTKGYLTDALIEELGAIVEGLGGQRVILVGAGNLGSAIASYFAGIRSNLALVAAFETDPSKIGTTIAGVPCLNASQIDRVVRNEGVLIAILAVPNSVAQETATSLTKAGVRALVNFTSVKLKTPADVFVQDVDISIFLEKSAYFGRVLAGATGPKPHPGKGKRVLYVDDGERPTETCREALVRAGYDVETVTGHAHVVRVALSCKPDLIIVDVAETARSGLGLVRKLRKDAAIRFTPILLLATPLLLTQVEGDNRRGGSSLPVDGLLDRSAPPPLLVSGIRRLLGMPRNQINVDGVVAVGHLHSRGPAA